MHPNALWVLPDRFAVCRLDPGATIPAWAFSGAFSAIVRTSDELSIVTDEKNIPSTANDSEQEHWKIEPGWSALKVEGQLDFALTGILAAIATPLAAADIPIFAISTYNTDYILVKSERLPTAIAVLERSGYGILRS